MATRSLESPYMGGQSGASYEGPISIQYPCERFFNEIGVVARREDGEIRLEMSAARFGFC
jgi:hypothetical protein